MKNIILLVGFSFLVLSKSFGQDPINSCGWLRPLYPIFDLNNRDTVNKYFYFDTAQTNNIWQLGAPSKTVFDTAHSRYLAIVTDTLLTYPNNNTSSFKIIVNTLDCNIGSISFWHRFNTDTLKDGGIVEYSTDGGSTWDNIINSTYTLYNFYSSTMLLEVTLINQDLLEQKVGLIQELAELYSTKLLNIDLLLQVTAFIPIRMDG